MFKVYHNLAAVSWVIFADTLAHTPLKLALCRAILGPYRMYILHGLYTLRGYV